jgi:hypothetical protein
MSHTFLCCCSCSISSSPTPHFLYHLLSPPLILVALQAVAFGKLQGILGSAPLTLPGKNQINLGLLAGIIATGGLFLTSDDPGKCVRIS